MSTPRIAATVAVTGMNATDNPAPGVAIVRSLRKERAFAGKVIGLGYDALDPGFYAEGLLDGGALLPYPSSGRQAMLHRLSELRELHGIDVFMPSLDSELRAVSSLAKELMAQGIRTFVPTIDSLERTSKARLAEFGTTIGMKVPASETVQSAAELLDRAPELGFPIVVKGPYYGAEIVHTPADAVTAFHRFAASWGLPIVIQRYIVGEEYNVAALGDGLGNAVGAVAMRKMALTDKGKGWSGVTISNPDLSALARTVIGSLQFRGGLEIEVLRERASGALYVIEINPRFPAWVYLCAAAGQNLPYYSVRLALGLDVPKPAPDYRIGTMFVRISLDQVSDMTTFGELTARGLVSPREVAA